MANGSKFGRMLFAAAIAGLVTGGVSLNTASADEPLNNGGVSVSGGFDIVTEYWFRGIPQEDQGVIIQPYMDVAFDLAPLGEVFEGTSLYVGTWGSVHEAGSPSAAGAQDGTGWFEQDVYAGVSIELPYSLSFDMSYIILFGPDSGGIFAEEIDVSLGWDDSGVWGDGFMANGLQPYVLFAFEVDGGSDGFGSGDRSSPAGLLDGGAGIYMEFGVEPSWTILHSEDFPVDFSIPVTVGFGLADYYEYVDSTAAAGTAALEDEDFGFFSVGFMFSTPLSFMPAEWGSWSTYSGVTVLVLNEDYASNAFNAGPATGAVLAGQDYDDDDIRAIWSFGISFEY